MKLSNQKGATLLELVMLTPLIALIFIPFGLATAHLFRTMDEIRLEAQLQQDMVDVLEIIRVGYIDKELVFDNPTPEKIGLIGISDASEVKIYPSRKGITAIGVPITIGFPYETSYYTERGEVLTSGKYELRSFRPTVIFPPWQSDAQVAGRPRFFVENLEFSNPLQSVENNAELIDVTFTASVRYRKKSEEEGTDDDLSLNKRTLTFDMRVYLGNITRE